LHVEGRCDEWSEPANREIENTEAALAHYEDLTALALRESTGELGEYPTARSPPLEVPLKQYGGLCDVEPTQGAALLQPEGCFPECALTVGDAFHDTSV
jgi:hypothetical protein